MSIWLIIIPVVLVVLFLIYSISRSLSRAWLEHHVRLALLERLQRKPELIKDFEDIQGILENEEDDSAPRQDFTLTGVILAVIGAVCVILYWSVGRGQWAVGAYFGGVVCVTLGFILAVLGLLIRFLGRAPKDPGV